ncbi:MAG: uroporphyrinogen decarboxylase [Hyphomicrobiaceae bacterium]|nr:uroporphyrinogen decarboxylase [Hyphomicrobiaceae bacterium]
MSDKQPTLLGRSGGRRFLKPFARQQEQRPPIWLMRQAGRYLPEYREVRTRAGSFLDLCYSPELAVEVTLQPIRRYGFDAAIVFSDILVVPDALGQAVSFVEGEGPRLDPVSSAADLARLDPLRVPARLAPVYETVRRCREALPAEVALIGFCGAPWTVATYMAGGRGTPDQAAARLWAYRDPNGFDRLVELVTSASIDYLTGQVAAGADALQIFDSWAGSLPDSEFDRWVVAPTRRIVGALKARHPDVPVIGFPRGAGEKTARYARETGVDGVGCDTSLSLGTMKALAGTEGVVAQGNLDPLLLVAGGAALETRVRQILAAMQGLPFVFNLGHGIVPQTPPEHVARLVDLVRGQG